MDTPHRELQPGASLGPYVLGAMLGAGGMGEVFRAIDTRLRRDVAVKLLPADLSADSGRRQRFEREALAVARLNHPNILTLHDIGEHDGILYLVTELLEGETLRARLATGLPAWRQALQWAVDLLSGLAAAHDHGVVHRDLKPDNVWLTRDDRIKILDFGIAKIATPGDAATRSFSGDGPAPLTRSGMILGTTGYMSPEQIRGLPVDARSDIFAFGALLYEMLGGRRPFDGGSPMDVMTAVLRDDPLPLALPPGAPPTLGGLVARCLAKEPGERFADARETARALESLGDAPGIGGSTRPAHAGASPDPDAGRIEQRIAYCTTADGVRIAYATAGNGPVIVRVLGWFTHLEMEWAWPALRFLWQRLAEEFTVVRYDGRGIGLSDRWTADFTEETRQLDLDAVLNAVGAGRAALFGISEGAWTAATYATTHPDRIDGLVIYGGYARGKRARPGFDAEEDRALLTLMRKGWGRETPAFRQVFTSQFFHEDADPELLAYFNELQRASADPETAARYVESSHARGDGTDIFRRVRTPTLVVHRRGDRSVSFEEGRHCAALIPGARFLPLPGSAHYFPTGRPCDVEPGTLELVDGIAGFLRNREVP
jgi:pimeloyl-ACP methyl ester carboxylesterase